MPIQRQSESFGIFDDGPRYARDRTTLDIPKGLAGLINTTGPRIQGGMLNTRTAVNTDGMHPDSHAYHTELPPGRGGEVTWVDDAENYGRNPRREYNPDFGYEPTDEDERRQEGVAEDDDSGYNWGPEPRRASRHPFDRTAGAWEDFFGEEMPSPFAGKDPERFFLDWLERGGDEEQHRHHESSRHIVARRFLAFDWKPVKWADPEATDEMYRAKLENGHALSCYQIPDAPDHGWMWSIYEPVKPGEHPNPQAMRYVAGDGGEGLYPTFDHARQAAEDEYQQRYPIGTDTGSHDSGNDYTDLSGYMKHLESHRLAADGMSYEETMSHIDKVLAEGEGHELHNYPGADAKPLPVRSRGELGGTELASSPLSPDECVLYHPHDGEECQDLADIHWHNDGRHHDYSHPPMPYMEGSKRVSGEMPVMDPTQMQMPQGGGYQIGHRVGLPWRENVIPGTVIGLDGPNTNIRWDDGQYSTEEPRNIQLL
jgi:hypothetical protein